MAEKESTSQAEVTEVHNEEVTPTEGQQEQGDGGEGEKAPETTKEPEAPKTYGKDEWEAREREFQSERDKAIAETNKAHKEVLAEKEEQIRKTKEAAEDKKLDDWVKSVENDGGDVDAAKRVAEQEKAVRKREQATEERERKAAEIEASQQSTLKYLDAQKLAKEHDIPVEPLMEAKSPEEMKVIALTEENKKLKTTPKEKGKKEERPVTTTDKGLGTGGGQPLPETAQGKMRAGWDELHKNK